MAEAEFAVGDTNAPNLTKIEIAQANINRYNRFWSSIQFSNSAFKNTHQISAFTINTRDVLKTHGFAVPPGCAVQYHTRVYIGLDSLADGMNFKFYLLPVVGVGDEIVTPANPGWDTVFKYISGQPPRDTVYYALELNAPCPNTCAISSRLKTGATGDSGK